MRQLTGLDTSFLTIDPAFDHDFHVRKIALPPPGDRYQLAEQVSRIVARPLDRSRPCGSCTSSTASRAATSPC